MLARYANGTHTLHRLRHEMDRMFSDVFGQSPMSPFATAPALNVWEDEGHIYAEAEVPGLSMKDLDVTVAGNELTLKGVRNEPDTGKASYHRRERTFGAFVRTIRLPVDLDADKVEARLQDGVLTITMPKAPAAKARKIQVRGSDIK